MKLTTLRNFLTHATCCRPKICPRRRQSRSRRDPLCRQVRLARMERDNRAVAAVQWVCERLGEAMPDPAGGFRRHSALYDAEQTARLYHKLVRMLAAGQKIYAHLPAGAPPAADSVDAPTYLEYRMPSDRRDEVRRLGACWDAVRSRYYVPAGVGLVAFEGWRERPPRREGQC